MYVWLFYDYTIIFTSYVHNIKLINIYISVKNHPITGCVIKCLCLIIKKRQDVDLGWPCCHHCSSYCCVCHGQLDGAHCSKFICLFPADQSESTTRLIFLLIHIILAAHWRSGRHCCLITRRSFFLIGSGPSARRSQWADFIEHHVKMWPIKHSITIMGLCSESPQER